MRNESRKIYEKALKVIPGGVNSPVRAFPGLDLTPLIAAKGQEDTVYDVDGNAYIDFCCSWGALILGHAHPDVVREASLQVELGSSFGLSTAVEEEFASWMAHEISSIDKIRFVSSGTEATMTALRLGRAFTGRSKVVKFDGNYHGHSDALLIRSGSGVLHQIPSASSMGVPSEVIQNTISLPFNETAVVESYLESRDDIAAVIIEPIAGNMGVVLPAPAFLQMLRRVTLSKNIVLIFDEVITGFRVAFGGAQALYDITPDLSCYSKIIGGGFPVGAVGGREEIMNLLAPLGAVYQAGTLSGNPVAMRAGLTVLRNLKKSGVYEDLERKAALFVDPIQSLIKESGLSACLNRVGSMMTLFFGPRSVESQTDLQTIDHAFFKFFFKSMFEQGVYIPPSPFEAWFISTAHTEKHLLRCSDIICSFLKDEANQLSSV